MKTLYELHIDNVEKKREELEAMRDNLSEKEISKKEQEIDKMASFVPGEMQETNYFLKTIAEDLKTLIGILNK